MTTTFPTPHRGKPRGWRLLVRQAFLLHGKPDIPRGVRSGIVVGLPLLVAVLAGHPGPGQLISLGALQAEVVDGPSPYRSRAVALLWTGILGGLATFIGVLAGNDAWLAVVVTGSWCGVIPFSGAFGSRYESILFVTAVLLLFGLLTPAGWTEAAIHAGLVLLGVAWGALVPLAGWRWRRDRPPTRSAVTALRATADLVAKLAGEASRCRAAGPGALRRGDARWTASVVAARQTITEARGVLEATYGTGRSDLRLFRLVRGCERTVVRAGALRENLDAFTHDEMALRNGLVEASAVAMTALAQHLDVGAKLLERSLDRTIERGWNGPELRESHAETGRAMEELSLAQSRAQAEARSVGAGTTVAELDMLATATVRLADGVHVTVSALVERPPHRGVSSTRRSARQRIVGALGPHLKWSSPRARLAARLAICVTLAQSVVLGTGIPHGIWLLLGLLTVLKPEQTSTWSRALQRTAGTTVGAFIAASLLTWVTNEVALVLVIIVLTAACLALFSVNYSYFVILLTPLALMLGAVVAPGNWRDALLRLVLTASGAGTAVLADAVLWPMREGESFRASLASAIDALARYFDSVLAGYEEERLDVERVVELRRRAEDAEAITRDSLNRLELGSRADQRRALRGALAVQGTSELLRTIRSAAVALRADSGSILVAAEQPLVHAIASYRQRARQVFGALCAEASAAGDPGADRGTRTDRKLAPVTADATGLLTPPPELSSALDTLLEPPAAATGTAAAHGSMQGALLRRWNGAARMLQRVDDEIGRLARSIEAMSPLVTVPGTASIPGG